ncbi:hypothetical protein ASG89_14355 [Paenibacillus sp. Soil766]|uniref:hypothetical protein n=1 Tax=Paenibacillus sp. Soil766 TaxID=1736404 RepID=UPI0007097410|nr:hypothetical protein [Paenibacillus sp. Soil766]KRE82435.1 hypothetical protein ASG89_14355 [Paenibacillus sp. Soil766]
MSLYVYYIIFAAILITGAVATIAIGHSNKNKEGNPGYDRQTKSIFVNLTLYYAVIIPLGLLALVVYIVKFIM